MQPLETYDLVLNIVILVMMPLIILANMREIGFKSPFNLYLWREHAHLMRASLAILGLLVLFSAASLLGHFGLVSAAAVETASMTIGIVFLLASLLEIVLVVAAARKELRIRRTGGMQG